VGLWGLGFAAINSMQQAGLVQAALLAGFFVLYTTRPTKLRNATSVGTG